MKVSNKFSGNTGITCQEALNKLSRIGDVVSILCIDNMLTRHEAKFLYQRYYASKLDIVNIVAIHISYKERFL